MRREVPARLVQHVGGHLHRRQRGAQLVRDVGGEPLLQLGEALQLGDLPLQAVGHRVEAGRQAGEVVLAAHGHPLLELPLGQPLGGAGRPAHRVDDQPGDQHTDADDEQGQRDAADDDRAADQGEALLLLGQREGVVELDLLGCRRRRWAPARRSAASAAAPARRRASGAYLHDCPPSATSARRSAGRASTEHGGWLPAARSHVAGPVDHDDVEVAGRAAAVEQLGAPCGPGSSGRSPRHRSRCPATWVCA